MGLGSSANGALVTITKEVGQAASTFVAANAAKMFARMPGPYLNGAVWLVNPEILPQLKNAGVDKEVRGWDKSSDHAPVWVQL